MYKQTEEEICVEKIFGVIVLHLLADSSAIFQHFSSRENFGSLLNHRTNKVAVGKAYTAGVTVVLILILGCLAMVQCYTRQQTFWPCH